MNRLILTSFIVLVPLLRCTLFFDSYLIKLWVVQFGIALLFITAREYPAPIHRGGDESASTQGVANANNSSRNKILRGLPREYFIRKIKLGINPIVNLLLWGYLSVNIISWSLIPSPYKYPALLSLAAFLFYILLCFFVSQYLREDRDLIVSLWIITTVIISLYSIWQYLHHIRVIGTLGNENFLASHIGISIPVCIGFFWRYLKSPRWLLLGLIILMLFLFTLYLTHARGGWLGLFGSLSTFAIIGFCPKGKRLLIIIFLLILFIGLALTPWGVRFIITQFQGDVRPAIWEGTLCMITEKPLLGWGKGAYFIFYPGYRTEDYWLAKTPTDLTIHAHNEFLQILAETGLIGLIIFLLFIYIVLRFSIREIDKIVGPERYLLLGLTCGIIGLLVHNLTCNNLQMPSSAIFLWFMLGLVISYFKMGKGKKMTVPFSLALTLLMVIIIIQTAIRPLVSQYLFKRGLGYRDSEKWDLAIEEYKKAINWYPWDVEMHYRMAYAYAMGNRNDRAIEKYKDVLRLAVLYGSVHRNMGIIYMKMGEYRLAVKSFLQALRINEHDLITQVNLGRIKERYGNK